MSIEGAMLGGSFLPEQEFKDLMKQVWDQQQGNIKAAIHNCILNIESGNILMAYKNWELFQTDILKNPKTQILAITNFYNHNGINIKRKSPNSTLNQVTQNFRQHSTRKH